MKKKRVVDQENKIKIKERRQWEVYQICNYPRKSYCAVFYYFRSNSP